MSSTLPAVLDRDACAALDAADPLRHFRDRFVVNDSVIYLDGNSLGRLPAATPARMAELVEREWGRGLVRSWTDAAWMASPLRLGDKIARLVGADADEIVVTDTTSVDLFKLAVAALRAAPDRHMVLTEDANFPTDLYIASAVAGLVPGTEVRCVTREQLEASLDGDVALLMLTHVDYRSGEKHDMRSLSAAARAAGALTLWDLSHSTGAVQVDLHADGADLATGCGYKYLNGGPGAPAFLYVARALQPRLRNPIAGWLGHAEPFNFEASFRAAEGVRAWMSGSPPVMAIAALEVSIDMFLEAGMDRVAGKGAALTDLFIALADARLAEHGVTVASPRESARRGAQVALRHTDGYGVVRALIDRGVIGDFRPPDICRFGLAPLYTRYTDVWDAIELMRDVMASGAHRDTRYSERAPIT